LAVALGVGHTEVPGHAVSGGAALLDGDDRHRAAAQSGDSADDGRVVAEAPVSVELHEVGEDKIDVVQARGTVRAAGRLDPLIAGFSRHHRPPPLWRFSSSEMVSRCSFRGTTASTKPCSSRNSAFWKPW